MRTIISICTVILVSSHNIEYAKDHFAGLCAVSIFAFLWDLVEIYFRMSKK